MRRTDKRYSIRLEWGGWAKAMWVVRFCGEFVDYATSREAAYELAADHFDNLMMETA